jgi:hypothetical protein
MGRMAEDWNAVPDALLRDGKHHRIGEPVLVVQFHTLHPRIEAAIDLVQRVKAGAGLDEAPSADSAGVVPHRGHHAVVALVNHLG